jgi:hypothetical protein
MGATSVTGVGPGAADGNKGPGNGRDQFVPLLTPHVVAAGTVVLAGGVATVTFPTPLDGSEVNYSVMLTPEAANLASVSAKTDNSDGDFASFAVAGGATDNVMWTVIKTGNA